MYASGEDNVCYFCECEIKFDELIEELVIALNVYRIRTTASCDGHFCDFDGDSRNYPWVALEDDDKNILRARELVSNYNATVSDCSNKEWLVETQKTLRGYRRFLVPNNKNRGSRELQENISVFAKYIISCC